MDISSDLGSVGRERLQKKTLWVLFVASAAARAGLSLVFAVAALLVEQILGSEQWTGSALAVATAGTAISSTQLSTLMNRHGRRRGMVVGFLLAAIGCAIAGIGGQLSMIVLLLGGLFLVGVGLAATSLARYAAADLAQPLNKAKAISSVVFASTVGAVIGPSLAGPSDWLGGGLGLEELVGAFLFGGFFFIVAATVTWLFLRPDPLVVSGGLQPKDSMDQPSLTDGFRALTSSRPTLLAVAGLSISTAVMVMVMAMTPVHMVAHDHRLEDVGWVISVHTAGMFAFAPIAGYASDKIGRRATLAMASGLLVFATTLTALAGDAPLALMFAGLFLLGLGWSFGFVAASALLSESIVDPAKRIAAQGSADFVAATASGVSALASGFVVSMAGYHILSMIGTSLAGLLGVFVVLERKNSASSPRDAVQTA